MVMNVSRMLLSVVMEFAYPSVLKMSFESETIEVDWAFRCERPNAETSDRSNTLSRASH